MKFFILYFLVFISFSLKGQNQFTGSTEFALKDKSVVLYKDIRYHASDTLVRLNRMYEVYLVEVDSCIPNFCRVKSYHTLPYMNNQQVSDSSYWVESENLESALHGTFSVFKEPFLTNKENLKLKVEDFSDIYFKVDIVTVKKDWVKIKFKVNDQSLIGWVDNTSLCPLKHAECEDY
jgi:hypothetical protein